MFYYSYLYDISPHFCFTQHNITLSYWSGNEFGMEDCVQEIL